MLTPQSHWSLSSDAKMIVCMLKIPPVPRQITGSMLTSLAIGLTHLLKMADYNPTPKPK